MQLTTEDLAPSLRALRLAGIANRVTAYEIVVIRAGDGVQRLLCYSQRPSLAGLHSAIGKHSRALQAFLPLDTVNGTATDAKENGRWVLRTSEGHFIGFTGRTERDCVMSGEIERLPAVFEGEG